MPICRHKVRFLPLGLGFIVASSHVLDMMHDGRLVCTANTLLCSLSIKLLVSSPHALEIKIHEDEIRGEHQFRLCKPLDNSNCVQKLPKNEPSIVSKTEEYTSMEDRSMETNPKAVRGLIHILPTL